MRGVAVPGIKWRRSQPVTAAAAATEFSGEGKKEEGLAVAPRGGLDAGYAGSPVEAFG